MHMFTLILAYRMRGTRMYLAAARPSCVAERLISQLGDVWVICIPTNFSAFEVFAVTHGLNRFIAQHFDCLQRASYLDLPALRKN